MLYKLADILESISDWFRYRSEDIRYYAITKEKEDEKLQNRVDAD